MTRKDFRKLLSATIELAGVALSVQAGARAVAVTGLAATVLVGCLGMTSGPFLTADDTTRLISYNVQNLFDDRPDGGEYSEFRPEAGWDRSRYYERLERLERVIRDTSGRRLPDMLVLQELESVRVAADLAADFVRRYRYIAGAVPGRSSTQVVVLSRERPALMRTHRVSVVAHVPAAGGAPTIARASRMRVVRRGRDLLELAFTDRSLHLLAAHWKSQSGGEALTEPMRIAEARLAQAVVSAREMPAATAVLLIGDLNEDLHEARQHDFAYETALVERGDAVTLVSLAPQEAESGGSAESVVAGPAVADEPWFRSLWTDRSGRGTYWYRGRWERLDHAFLRAGPQWSGRLRAVVLPAIVSAAGIPLRYDPRTGRGYSDHLPILVDIERTPADAGPPTRLPSP